MSNIESLGGPVPPAQGPNPPRKPRYSTFVVGAITLMFAILGAVSSGIGGALIFLAISAALTGLYVLVTGRRSWAWLPAGRKAGAVVLAGSLVGFIVGGIAVPKTPTADVGAVSSEKGAVATTSRPSFTSTPSSTPSSQETGSPLDLDSAYLPASNITFKAPNSQPAFATKAIDLLTALPIKGRAPKTGYDRSQFGQSWADVDRNGCDTRNDTLKRDLTKVTYTNSVPCKVQSGILADPYTGTTINFIRGATTSDDVQIDHVVALSDAWQKGAQQLSFEQRMAFANDPLNLQSTDGPTNQQKGDGDAATWLPPNKAFRCEYVARQISVKATYSLWVSQAEHDAMARVLSDCPNLLAPTNQPASTPTPTPTPIPSSAAAPAPAVGAFPNCSAAAAAGVYNIPAGAPGYGPHLDSDRDGIGCEAAGVPYQPAPGPVPVAPAPAPAPAPVQPAPAPASVYYANCTAARQAGAAPLYTGQPGYRPALDRDSDGIACE